LGFSCTSYLYVPKFTTVRFSCRRNFSANQSDLLSLHAPVV
jgi:hypothetical protein